MSVVCLSFMSVKIDSSSCCVCLQLREAREKNDSLAIALKHLESQAKINEARFAKEFTLKY